MAARKILGRFGDGFLTLPLRAEKATEDDQADIHTVCTGDGETKHAPVRVKQTVACPECKKAGTSHYEFPNRGVEKPDGTLAVLTQEEITQAKGQPVTGKADCPVTIKFHSREKVYGSAPFAGSVNNLTPDKGGEKSYAALVNFLQRHPDKVALFIWAPRTNNAMWVLEATEDGRLVASAVAWPEVVRLAPAVAPVELSDAETNMFEQMAAMYTSDFDPAEYVNTAQHGMTELIAAAAGVDAAAAPVASGGDMLAALEATLKAVPSPKAPAKKRTPRKKAESARLPQSA